MAHLSIITLLVFIWIGFSNNFSLLNIIFGILVAFSCHHLVSEKNSFSFRFHPLKFVSLIFYTIGHLFISSCQVAWEIITPQAKSTPAIFEVPLELQNKYQKLLLTIIVSLTPGTLCLDIPDDENRMIVHAMFAADHEHVKHDIVNNLQRRVMEVFEHVENS